MTQRKLDIIINGRDQVSTKLGRIESRLTKFARVAGIAVTAAATASAAALAAQVRQQFAVIDSAAKMSDRLGIATDDLMALRHAAKLAGLQSATLEMALQRMTRRVAEAAKGSGEAVGALQELGLDAISLSGQSPDQMLLSVADALAAVDKQADRIRLAMKLFDSEGVALLQLIQRGSGAIREATAEARRLGIAVDDLDAEKIEQANDAVTRLQASFAGVANELAVSVAPLIERMAEGIADMSQGFRLDVGDVVNSEFTQQLADTDDQIRHLRDQINNATGQSRRNVSRLKDELREAIALRGHLKSLIRSENLIRRSNENADPNPLGQFAIDPARQGPGGSVPNFLGDYQSELRRFAESLRETTREPFEVFRDELERLREAHGLGFIDDELLIRGLERAREELRAAGEDAADAVRSETRLAGLDQSRFTTGVSDAARQDRQTQEALRIARETNRAAEHTNALVADLLRTVNAQPVVVLGDLP